MINKGKTVFLPDARFFKTDQVSEDEEKLMMFFSRRSLYYGRAGSDVMGCRRPTDGVFTYVSSDTSHAEGVPRSDP